MTSPNRSFKANIHPGVVVILGTGGTIAGTAPSAQDHHAYRSAQLSVGQLVAAVPSLAEVSLECEQVAQVDSKDMTFAIWVALAKRIRHHLGRPEVAGVVVTHGTDTLEETAVFLNRVLRVQRPVVLTAAMRPATSSQADGPQNLADAVTVARATQSHGVLAVMGGQVWCGEHVRKIHGHRIDAFSGGDAGRWGRVQDGQLVVEGPVERAGDRPAQGAFEGLALEDLPPDTQQWPWVEIVTSHAGAQARSVGVWVAAGVQGLVVAGTGNGTVHQDLQRALDDARAQGVAVVIATRCVAGGWVAEGGDADGTGGLPLTPAQARVDLMLRLMAA